MGNKQEKQFNEEELKIYLKEGLTMNDLIDLKQPGTIPNHHLLL